MGAGASSVDWRWKMFNKTWEFFISPQSWKHTVSIHFKTKHLSLKMVQKQIQLHCLNVIGQYQINAGTSCNNLNWGTKGIFSAPSKWCNWRFCSSSGRSSSKLFYGTVSVFGIASVFAVVCVVDGVGAVGLVCWCSSSWCNMWTFACGFFISLLILLLWLSQRTLDLKKFLLFEIIIIWRSTTKKFLWLPRLKRK